MVSRPEVLGRVVARERDGLWLTREQSACS